MAPLGTHSAALFLLVTLVVGVVAARRPALGLAALVVLDPFDWSHALGPTTITLPKAALVGLVLGLVARRASLHPLRAAASRPVLVGALAILVVTALSAAGADYRTPALREVAKAAEYVVLFAGALVAFAEDPDRRLVAAALVVGASLVALLALAQEFTHAPSALMVHGRVVPRIAGPLEGPNQLAGYFDVIVPTLLAFALRGVVGAWPALVLAAGADMLTFSRAGIVAAFVAALAVAALARPRATSLRAAGAVGAVGLALGAGLGLLGMLPRFASFNDPDRPTGLGTRSELWQAALVLWRRHPWLGVGGGNYELELPRAGVTDAQTHANSLYLQTLAEGGLALFAATVATLAAALWTLARRAGEPFALAAFGATVALSIHQVFDLLVYFPKVGVLWWLLLGVAFGAVESSAQAGAFRLNSHGRRRA